MMQLPEVQISHSDTKYFCGGNEGAYVTEKSASLHREAVRPPVPSVLRNCTAMYSRRLYSGVSFLRRFVLRRFTFTTLVHSDGALPTCGASLSQLKLPFSI